MRQLQGAQFRVAKQLQGNLNIIFDSFQQAVVE